MRSVAKHGYAVPRLRTLAFSDLAGLVREAITNERYFLSPRMKRLKSLLAKLDPASAERTVTVAGPRGHGGYNDCGTRNSMKIATATTAATTISPTAITYCTSRVTADPPRKLADFNLRRQCYHNVTVAARAERGKQASRRHR